MSSPESNTHSPASIDRRRNLARKAHEGVMEFASRRGPFLRHMVSETALLAEAIVADQQAIVIRLARLSKSFPSLEVDSAQSAGNDLVAREIGFLHTEASVAQEAAIIQESLRLIIDPEVVSGFYRPMNNGHLANPQWSLGSPDGLHGTEARAQLFGGASNEVRTAFLEAVNTVEKLSQDINAHSRHRLTKSGARRLGEKNHEKLLARLNGNESYKQLSIVLGAALEQSESGPREARRRLLIEKVDEIDAANLALSGVVRKQESLATISDQWAGYFKTEEGKEVIDELGLDATNVLAAALEIDALLNGKEHIVNQQPEVVHKANAPSLLGL